MKINKYFILLILISSFSFSQTKYEVEQASFNSPVSDFTTAYSEQGIIFSTERDSGSLTSGRWEYKGEERAFLQLYYASLDDSGNAKEIEPITGEINSKYHESSVSITNDGKTVYFTRNNFDNGKFGTNKRGKNLLKIYRATKSGNSFVNVVELPFNSDQFSTAHPALSPNNNRLYFASDRPGTKGASDIWYVDIDGKSYGEPVNLGNRINTSGRDTFPFIDSDGNLYFSSEKHGSSGGLDIFYSAASSSFTIVKKLESPINTIDDDFAYVESPEGDRGYFTSNRKNGSGSDDIYKFTKVREFQYIVGIVQNETSEEFIEGALVKLYSGEGDVLDSTTTDSEGNYSFEVDLNSSYNVIVRVEDEEIGNEKVASTNVPNAKVEKNFFIKDEVIVEETPEEGPKTINGFKPIVLNLPNIYFDLDKYGVRYSARKVLDQVVTILQYNPQLEMTIEIKSHTDSRGSQEYNTVLSDNRAKSTADYIISKGVDQSRIIGYEGYGELTLTNDCADDVNCDENKHQLNRRSELFIVISQK